jgi:hypothetical protein
VLKNAVPARDYNGAASSSACGLSFEVGNQYLFFLDGNNQPLYFSMVLGGEGYQAQMANSYLRTIQDFNNGLVGDLAEPWSFDESKGYCSMWHQVRSNRFQFIRRTTNAPQYPKPKRTRDQVNGETVYRANTPSFDLGSNLPAGTVELVWFGEIPRYPDDALSLSIVLEERSLEPVRRQATISVGSSTWGLDRMEMTFLSPGVITHTAVEYSATGDTAEQILAAMSKPSDIVVSATVLESNSDSTSPELAQADSGSSFRRADPDVTFTISSTAPTVSPSPSRRTPEETPEPVLRVESRSTQLPKVIGSFRSCYADDK